jgi:hypothetical protein
MSSAAAITVVILKKGINLCVYYFLIISVVSTAPLPEVASAHLTLLL